MPLYCSKGHENPPNGRFCLRCGEKLEQPVSQGIQAGQMLGGRYRVVRELGHGGFGRTFLAEDLNRFNELCVLKQFAPQVQGTYALQKAEELFAREAGVLYKLQHAQIPKFRELFQVRQQSQGFLFLVQDYVEGETYHALLESRKRQGLKFTEAEVTQLLRQILPVLEYIHSLGVIHRDISPDNLILRSQDGLPVLIDFGGVKQAAAAASQVMVSPGAGGMLAMPTRLGKIGYAPHEQMQGGLVSPHSDLYALGATVLVLLTGKEPQQLIDPTTLKWEWRREINLSPMLGTILDKLLQPTPGDRYQNAREVLQALTPVPVEPTVYPAVQPPLPNPEATVAVAPSPDVPVNPPTPPITTTPVPSATNQPTSGVWGKVLLVFILIFGAMSFGWVVGNLWIQSQIQSRNNPQEFEPKSTDSSPIFGPNDEPTPEASSEFSAEEVRRKEALQQRRVALDIRYKFYADLVNEEFWKQYPEQRGRTLGTGVEDAQARAQWDAIASTQLRQLAELNLTPASRRKLGNFGEADLTRWKAEANKLHVSSRSLYDLADARFFMEFPQEREQQFRRKPIGQVWYAMAAEALDGLKSGDALERINFEPGTVNQQVTGTLKSGEGKALIASLSKGQTMTVRLSTAQKALFSIYSPSGQTTLLEDSRDRQWSGTLPESGYYEFVIVSESSGPINYQLDLTVEDSTTSEPSPIESPQ
ncbi:MAG TPA: serine/threonine-protein kinase [Cyanophyceae cyanobacterium]